MEKQLRGLSGNFTIHFEVDAKTNEILAALARHRGDTVNNVAKNVIEGWVANTWREINRTGGKRD